jgi:hypothetical protein
MCYNQRLMSEKDQIRTQVWTDGGTSSNIPPFGMGYGSYRIGENGEIISLDFSTQMSANAAEILTMALVIEACESPKIDLYSDSRIGLNWVRKVQLPAFSVSENISEGMKRSIKRLTTSVQGKNIKPHWRPRVQIFNIFGH